MTFRLDRGIQTEIVTRTDICNVLRALEPNDPRAGFELGWLEALQRVGKAFAITYDAPDFPRLLTGRGGDICGH